MPENAHEVEAARVVVKENMSLTLAQDFLNAVNMVLEELEGKPSKLSRRTHGKYLR